MKLLQRVAASALLLALFATTTLVMAPSIANADEAENKVDNSCTETFTGKQVGAGLLSLLVWPGIGQAINDQPGKKIGTHAVIGLFPPYRFWSGYDAICKRQGGYWEGRI